MHIINAEQLKQVIKYGVFELNEPAMVIGQFGAGKTDVITEACEENDALCAPFLMGQYDTVDMKGTPWVGSLGTEGYQATVWHPASTLPFKGNPNFPQDKKILLFLDERTSATLPVLGICYQLVQARRVGEHELMDNVYIISAGNRESDKGIVNRQPMPLCNRETWFEFGVDVDQWCTWAQKKYAHDASIFVAFLQFRKPLICTYDPAKAEKNVATPRTWEKCIKYYKATMPIDIKMAMMAGAVGDGPAAEFWGFVDSWKKIADLMPKIIKEPLTAPIPEETSLQYAVAVALSGGMKEKTVPVLHQYLCRMSPELVVLSWQLALKRDPSLFSTPEFVDFSKRYKVIFS